MNKVFFTFSFIISFIFCNAQCGNLVISGIIDGDLSGGLPKAVQLCAIGDIADLSIYAVSRSYNGSFNSNPFPLSGSLNSGDCIWLATETTEFNNYFDFDPDITSGLLNVNGDDAVILNCNGDIEDIYGELMIDGTGTCWDYTDSYVITNSTAPNMGVFSCANNTIGSVENYTDYASIPNDPFGLTGIVVVNPPSGSCIEFTCADLEIYAVAQNSQSDNWNCSSNSWTANGYVGTPSTEVSDLWLIGGNYDFSNATTATLTLDADEGYNGSDLELFYTANYTDCPSETANNWQSFGTILTGGEANGLTFNLDAVAGLSNIYIGIQYTSLSGSGNSSEWEISNMKIESDNCPTISTPLVSDCTPCNITNASAIGACVGLDYVYEVNFTALGTSMLEVVNIATNVVIATGSTSPISITVANNSNNNPFNISVRDMSDNTCISNVVTINPTDCSGNVPCNPSVGVFPWNGQ